MSAEIFTVVKVPISQIAEWLRSKHDLPEKLEAFSIEGDSLIMNFKEDNSVITENSSVDYSSVSPTSRKRRTHKKRNRMKTRGWAVQARIINSKNQKCTIYKPFVDALQRKELTLEEQRQAVEGILRANGNKPTENSIQYYLENTLEYLRGVQ